MTSLSRPNRYDRAIQVGAAREFAPELTQWESTWIPTEAELEKIGQVLAEEYDAFRMARRLEQTLYLEGDTQLVDALDHGQSVFENYLRTQIAVWVKYNQVELPLKLFDRIRHPRYGLGTIVSINAKHATYGFRPKNREAELEKHRGYVIVDGEDFTHGLISKRQTEET